jgi:protein-tyrosine-phosphatase
MAEALLNRLGGGRFRAVSAGSRPAGAVDPVVITLLTRLRYPVDQLRSKSWSAFSGPAAPPIDLVISVCDDAAREPCPAFIGPALGVHWGIADPVAAPLAQRAEAVRAAYRHLSARLTEFATLDWTAMSPDQRAAALHRIARMDGATPLAIARAA